VNDSINEQAGSTHEVTFMVIRDASAFDVFRVSPGPARRVSDGWSAKSYRSFHFRVMPGAVPVHVAGERYVERGDPSVEATLDQPAVSAGDWEAGPAASAERLNADPATDGRIAAPSTHEPWMARTLARLGTPPDETGWELGAKEPLVLGRYFELHRERLTDYSPNSSRRSPRWSACLPLRSPPRGFGFSDGR
jgi:hypothetical protein